MKILHITSSLNGGAGIAAYRLHKALMQNGISSKILTAERANVFEEEIFEWKRTKQIGVPKKIQSYLVRAKIALTNTQRNYLETRGLEGNYEIVTSPRTDFDIEMSSQINWCDIIHLHWVSSYINYFTFFSNIDKPIVWTLHDANPFMGAFHLKMDLISNQNFARLESKYLTIKEKAVSKVKRLVIVSPSKWLLKDSKASSIFSNKLHQQIYNAIPVDKYYIIEKQMARKALGIGIDENIILLSSNVFTRNKGGDLLQDVINDSTLSHIKFHIIGNGKFQGKNITTYGSINSIKLQNLLYGMCDALLITSRNENLPNVMLEAMACGKPVLSFNVGGMAEMIKDGFNGLKANHVNASSLKNLLIDFFNKKDEFNSEEIRRFAVDSFSYSVIAPQYVKLYNKFFN